tara:strand:- start:1252 stop:1512 length:261 start_codon:yes stop_codon:yes gene_type:complete
MSHLSPEVIINDFEKLKEIFNKQEERFIWDTFSKLDFNFNKTLDYLLKQNDDISEVKTKKKFNPMDALSKIFKNNNDVTNDYQQLD